MENQFELLYDEKKKVNQRRSFTESIYPIPKLAPVQSGIIEMLKVIFIIS